MCEAGRERGVQGGEAARGGGGGGKKTAAARITTSPAVLVDRAHVRVVEALGHDIAERVKRDRRRDLLDAQAAHLVALCARRKGGAVVAGGEGAAPPCAWCAPSLSPNAHAHLLVGVHSEANGGHLARGDLLARHRRHGALLFAALCCVLLPHDAVAPPPGSRGA